MQPMFPQDRTSWGSMHGITPAYIIRYTFFATRRKPMAKKETVSVADIARGLKMSPKVARRKMRLHWKGHRKGTDWAIPVAKRGEVVKLLKATKPAAAKA